MSSTAVAKPGQTATKPASQTPVQTMAAARKGRKPVDPNELPEKKFIRLVEPRVTRALKTLKAIKNLARFKPTETQRLKVFGALAEAYKQAETAWKGDSVISEGGFKM